MNQSSRAIFSSSLAHLFNELKFYFKFNSFDSWTKFNESIVKLSLELYLSLFSSLSVLTTIVHWGYCVSRLMITSHRSWVWDIKSTLMYNIYTKKTHYEKTSWCNPTPQGHWIEDSKKIGPKMQEKALGFS